MNVVWNHLWMYYNLPRFIPIIAVALIGISFLYLNDSLGWIYGTLLWFFISVVFLDKLSQGILDKGVYRIHQGMVLGYYLSILGITLIYYGGNEYVNDYIFGSSPPSSSFENLKKESNESENKEKISHLGSGTISSFYLSLLLGLNILTLILLYFASVIRCKTHISTEDR